MELYNIKYPDEHVNFSYALLHGLGRGQGLFFPLHLPKFSEFEVNNLLEMNFCSRSVKILSAYIKDEISQEQVLNCVSSAFTFSVPVFFLENKVAILELFHGPTLAFKDFGARLMAQMLLAVNKKYFMTILTATSGDTGAAVAHAFYGMENIRVIILYPENKISILQEKLFCTLGDNIHTLAIDGDFDTCQLLVKQAFNDNSLKQSLFLNSANSMNICRLLAQVCYFFEAVAQIPYTKRKNIIISVPSGNFGNLTAGLLAKSLGLPIKNFIAATNINDTVPRFLKNGLWDPHPTIPTLSNAMDVSRPNNWERIMVLFQREHWKLSDLFYGSVDDFCISTTICQMLDLGYLLEPHSAVAYYLLCNQLRSDEFGLFLGTAHPAKFNQIIESLVGKNIVNVLLPKRLEKRMSLPSLSVQMPADFNVLRKFMLDL